MFYSITQAMEYSLHASIAMRQWPVKYKSNGPASKMMEGIECPSVSRSNGRKSGKLYATGGER